MIYRLNIICNNENELNIIQNHFLEKGYSWVVIMKDYYNFGDKLIWNKMIQFKPELKRGLYIIESEKKIGWFAKHNNAMDDNDNIIDAKIFMRKLKLNNLYK